MPPDPMFDPAQVHKLIKQAGHAPLAFAFASGESPEKSILGVHKTRTPDQLLSLVRKEAGSGKYCCGTIILRGDTAVFAAEKPFGNLASQLKLWFKANRISIRVDVAGPESSEPAADSRHEEKVAEPAEQGRSAAEDDGEDGDDGGNKLFSAELLLRRVRKSAKQPMQFAFGMGKDSDLLAAHPIKGGKQLALLIKGENGATKGGFGTMVLSGRVVELHCETVPAPGLKKRVRAKFKEWQWPFQVAVFGPGGEISEEEGDGEDAAVELKALRQRLADLLPELKAMVEGDGARREEVAAAYRSCGEAIEAGTAESAQALLDRLAEMIRTHRSLVEALGGRLAVVRQDAALLGATALEAAMRQAEAAIASRPGEAAPLLDELERRIAELASAGRRSEAAEIGRGAVSFATLRLQWEAARSDFVEAADNLREGFRALLQTPEFLEDPRSDEAETLVLVDDLADRLAALDRTGEAVRNALDSAADTPEQRSARLAAAVTAIDSDLARLGEFAELAEFEETAAGSFPTVSLMEASLAELRAALVGAANDQQGGAR